MDTIAGKVIERLTSLAADEFGLIWNLKDDLRRMENTVSAIRAKLLDAEAKTSNHVVSEWLRNLKDVLFDADDLLDDVSTEALIRTKVMTGNKMAKEVKLFFSDSNQIAYGLKIGHKMKEIRKRLDDIHNVKIQLQSIDHPVQVPVANREERLSWSLPEDDVIGRDEEKKLVLSYLLDNNVTDEVSIIPIVGIGGLGKTALAQFVYTDEAVQKHFDQKMWVCVSDEFSVKQIAQNMLRQTKNSEKDEQVQQALKKTSDLEQVQQVLRKKIEGKKFLLVLDDVWKEDLWLKFRSLLMKGAKGSMIIVTTRNAEVAKIMSTREPLFLKDLDDDSSWQLFSRAAFDGGKQPNDPRLVTIGKEIVKKCVGVPLAIRTIGRLLHSQNLTVDNWSSFKDTELSKIDPQVDKKILSILKLSYDHLGSDLKNCFAYCSMFPKDFTIKRETIIQLWIAQGFVPFSNQTRCPEDVGHECFMNLLSRSFFQDVERDEYGEIMTCKMHDLMHDLAMRVAENECVAISRGRKEENIVHRLRHLSFDFKLDGDWEFPTSSLKPKKLRTFMLPFGAADGVLEDREISLWLLIFCSKCKESLVKYDLGSLTSSLKSLRVLDVHDSGLKKIPKRIGKLKHLRYLDLSGNDEIKKLPESVTKLYNLQTLKLSSCKGLEELPRGINKLVSLRHLELDGCFKLRWMPHGLGQLTCLQTLTRFALYHERSGSARMSDLGGLSKLRGKLRIEGLEDLRGNTAEAKSAKVFLERQCFRELELVWKGEKDDTAFDDEMFLRGWQLPHTLLRLDIRFYGKSLPDFFENLSSLQELTIWDCHGLTTLPDSIGNLSSLQQLTIEFCDGLTTLPDSIGNLSSLQQLTIGSLQGLTTLPDSIGNLSSLQELTIEFRQGFTTLPDSIGNLSSLQQLTISDCDGLTTLPDSIGNLSSLPQLTIWCCRELTTLPDSIGNLSSLQQLTIWECDGLTTLPDSIGNLSSLQQLTIGFRQGLTTLPDSIGNLSSLQQLTIESCERLTTPPDSIGNLSSLQQLTIEPCDGLTTLPDSIGNLSSLQQLTIEFHQELTTLPDSIGNLSPLQQLTILHCDGLTTLPDSIGNLSSLQQLTIQSCHGLTTLPDSIGNLSSLQQLTIGPLLGLTTLPDSIGNLSSLQELTIRPLRGLTTLPDSIGNLSSLQQLTIESWHGLTTLPDSIGNLSSLQLDIGSCALLKRLPNLR